MKEQMMMGTSTVARVASIAALAHKGQFRRDGITEYIEHPRNVAEKVKGDEKAEMVAWLHDIIEDTNETVETLKDKEVPQDVIEAVVALTKLKDEEYDEYLSRVKQNELAVKVKIADMLHNLSDSPTKRQIKKYTRGLRRLEMANE